MCYAIPGKVIEVKDRLVTVDYFGEKKKARNDFFDLKAGDYIYAQGGFVINKVSAVEAESALSAWRELFFELKKVDLRFSRLDIEMKGIEKRLGTILDKALEERPLSREDLLYILSLNEPAQLDFLYKAANFLRQKYHGNACCVHGIIEISNFCRRGCHYCGIAVTNKELPRYRMTKEEIVETAKEAVLKHNFKALVLQSGEDNGYSIDELAEAIKQIRKNAAALIFISFGEMPEADLRSLYEAGARGILLRFETSNPRIYSGLHSGHGLESRIKTLEDASRIGYLVITGGLLGLPGQTNEDILEDILLAKRLNATMFSFGPFIAHPATPLAGAASPEPEDVLKVLAVCRLVEPRSANIVVTTALETLDPGMRKKGLLSGANSVMLNLTPLKYRKLYEIYPDRAHAADEITGQIDETISLLKSIGRAPIDLGAESGGLR